MKHKLSTTLALVVLTMVIAAATARAQTVANGPYYAWPSWDQQLPAATRFIVLANWGSNAVLDRETGLVWERSPSTSRAPWFNAQIVCKVKTVGNRKGWRLPTLQELATLVDGDPTNTGSPRLPPGHPFIGVQSSNYWSASTISTIAGSTSGAWGVDFFVGDVFGFGKPDPFFVWCVRGGQGVDPQ